MTADEIADIKANYAERRRCRGAVAVALRSRPSEADDGGHTIGTKGSIPKALGARRSAVLEDLRRSMTSPESNDEARRFYEEKIRSVIDDPALADLLIPDDHPIVTKRICTDSNYFQTFNRPNVRLISVRNTPIEAIDETGIATTDEHFEIDVLVLATGFDAMTGTLAKIDIVGRNGQRLVDDWSGGPRTYLGLGTDGFPNLFLVSDRVRLQCWRYGAPCRGPRELDRRCHRLPPHSRLPRIEPSAGAVENWMADCAQRAEATLFTKANSWYVGANVPVSLASSCCSSAASPPTSISARGGRRRLQGIRPPQGAIDEVCRRRRRDRPATR